MSTKISIVVAAAENDVIGLDGDMPWHLSTDLKRFKALTLGKPMIMGRKTFMAIGSALPGRTSIVVTRDTSWQAEGVVPAHSLDQAIALATEIAKAGDGENCGANGMCHDCSIASLSKRAGRTLFPGVFLGMSRNSR